MICNLKKKESEVQTEDSFFNENVADFVRFWKLNSYYIMNGHS